MITYTSLLSRFVYFFLTDTLFDLVYCTYTTNILIPNGRCLFISGSGTKKLLWLPTLLSYQGLYYFWTDTVFGLVYAQTFQYWMEDAGLSLAQEKKNFYDYLHFSPIKVCNYFWTDTVFGLLYCTLTINILIPTGGCLFISGPGTKELLWLTTLLSYQGLQIFLN